MADNTESIKSKILGVLIDNHHTTGDIAKKLGYVDAKGHGEYKNIAADMKKRLDKLVRETNLNPKHLPPTDPSPTDPPPTDQDGFNFLRTSNLLYQFTRHLLPVVSETPAQGNTPSVQVQKTGPLKLVALSLTIKYINVMVVVPP